MRTSRLLGPLALALACAEPSVPAGPPPRQPDFAGVVVRAGTTREGTARLAVELSPEPNPAVIAEIAIAPGGTTWVRSLDGELRVAQPAEAWVGHRAYVWVAHPLRVPVGVSFEAPAQAVVVADGAP